MIPDRVGRGVTVSLSLALALCAAAQAAPPERLSLTALDLSRPPTTRELVAAGQLGGPLDPTHEIADAKRSAAINASFGHAIQAWNSHEYVRAVGLFKEHLAKFPDSPWAAEAELHMGCDARYQGRYREAREHYRRVTEIAGVHRTPGAAQMRNKARLREALLDVAQNDADAAQAAFTRLHAESADWRHRTYASHWIQRLSQVHARERDAFNCGVLALGALLDARGNAVGAAAVRAERPASDRGNSLLELVALARAHGEPLVARRLTVADLPSVPLPAILQVDGERTGRGHYWVLESIVNGAAHLLDPQSGRRFTQSSPDLAHEWDGNALLSDGVRASLGAPIDESAQAQATGGCCGAPAPETGLGPPGPPTPPPPEPPPDPQCAPGWIVNPLSMNLYMADTPLWYRPAYGPQVAIRVAYNSLSATAYHEPVGRKWQLNYATYLVRDTADSVIVYMPDGRRDQFNPLGGGQYGAVPPVQNQLAAVGADRYELRLTDGTVYTYAMPTPVTGGLITQYFLVSLRDPHGLALTFAYDAAGNLVTITDAPGAMTTLAYDTLGRVATVTEPGGRSARFVYDGNGDLVQITDMGGYATSFSYSSDAYLASLDGATGHWEVRIEPADGNPKYPDEYPPPGEPMFANYRVTITDPNGHPEEHFWYGGCAEGEGCAGFGWYVSPRDYIPWRSSTINNYRSSAPKTRFYPVGSGNAAGQVGRIRTPGGTDTQFQYDPTGNPIGTTDTHGHSWSVGSVNGRGMPLSLTDPAGSTTSFTYAANGLDAVQVTDELGSITLEYTVSGDLLSRTDRLGHKVSFTYNGRGQRLTRTDPLGTTTYTYTTGGIPASATRGGAALYQRTFDAHGRVAAYADRSGVVRTITYDDLDRVTRITYPDGLYEQFDYAECCPSRLESQTSRAGRVTRYVYDTASRLVELRRPGGSSERFEYDWNGNRTRIVDAAGHATRLEYDLDNRPTRRIFANGTAESIVYDREGLVTTFVNARGAHEQMSYGPRHETLSITYDDGTPGVADQYDGPGRLVQRTDGVGTWTYTYDAESQVTAIDGPWANDTVHFAFDGNGNVTSMAADGGAGESVTYDALGRISTVQSGTRQYSFAYTGARGWPASLSGPGGVTTSYAYDPLGRLGEIASRRANLSIISRHAFSYDADGRRTGETLEDGFGAPPSSASLDQRTYDATDALLTTSSPSRSQTFDADGNLLTGLTAAGEPFTAAYDAANRLKTLDVTASGGHTRHYDVQFAPEGGIARVVEKDDGVVVADRRFVRGPRLALQERNAANSVVSEYVWGPNRGGGIEGLLQLTRGSSVYQYLHDGKSSVAALVDASGTIAAAYQFDPFGAPLARSGALQQDFGFMSKAYDGTTGLADFGQRFYAPLVGRWTSRDPVRDRGGLNLYAFVDDDPLNVVDPWGLQGAWGGMGTYGYGGAQSWCRSGPATFVAWGPRKTSFWGAVKSAGKNAVGHAWASVGGGSGDDSVGGPNAVVGVRG